ncbi:uncharacterized protein LOC118415806 [Branchiostoma floridae]|uniref:chitinase n=1 Tax=Branchiostoma floridae TaxID=7739 RepID=A0A9J7L706_BRAFL|nr:uncharacterized protein LOC118415806 [Branchiostoma floridae]
MYPDPQDCTMFYQCTGDLNNPVPVHKDCAPGTLFDWSLSVCTLTSHCVTSPQTTPPPPNAVPTTIPTTNADPTTVPTTNADPTTVPTTNADPTTVPTTNADPTTVPTTNADPTTLPTTNADPTTLPTTNADPTTVPTTNTDPTTLPTTNADPTTVPTTNAGSTTLPLANAGTITLPPANAGPTTPPSANANPTTPPSANANPTPLPPANAGPTTPPSANANPTTPPSANAGPTTPPSANANPTPLLPANANPTTPPSANANPTPLPPANAGPTTPPSANANPTTPPSANAGPTAPPSANANPTTPSSANAGPTTLPPANAGLTTLPSANAGLTTLPLANADPTTPPSANAGPTTPSSANAGPTTPLSANAGPTTLPSANANPTTLPPANAGLTTPPSANAGPTTLPSANANPTTPPSANVGPTTPPSANAGPTTLPSANANPTTLPPANAGLTTPPSANAGPTTLPSANANPTTPPSANAGPTTLPSANANPTTLPPANAGLTTPPSANAGPTTLPSANANPTTPPSANVGPTTPPSANANPTPLPPANAGLTTLPSANANPTTPPSANAGPTTLPSANASPTTLPLANAGSITLPSANANPTTLPNHNNVPTNGVHVQASNGPVADPNMTSTTDIVTLKPPHPGTNLVCPNMPAGLDPSDFTDVKFILVFAPPINFTDMMSTSLDTRQHLENVTEEMASGSFPADVAATVANIWPKEIEISFTIHKDVNRKDINMTAEAEEFYTDWTDGRVVLDIPGTGVPMKPAQVSYERGFWSICQQDCSTIVSEDSCESVPSCGWCTLNEGPECGDNCYLVESIDMSAFFPCMFIPTDVNVTSQMQQDVADSFLTSLRNALQSRGFQVPEKVIHAVQVGRDTIDFRIQRTMGYQNLTGLQSAIQEILSWDEEFTVSHDVDGQHVEYRAANPDDEFNNTVKFEISLEDVNGDDIDLNNIMESNFTLRDVLEQDIINFVSNTLGPSSVATLNLDNIWIQSNYCTFSISVPLDQVHAIEAEARRLVSNIGNFNINVGSLQATAVDYKSTESCDFCPPVCAPRDTQACYTHTSCQWCVFEGAPHCGADCLLQETEYELSVSCPCLSEPIGSEQQLQDSFRDRVLQLLRERYGGWNSAKTINSVHITPPTITFSLKSSMQQRITPDVISFLSNMSIWNGITITDGFNQYEVMEPTAPTDLYVTMEFQNVDFTNLVTQHSVSAVHLLPRLKTTLGSIGVSQECVDTTKILGTQDNFLEFSMTRAWDSTVNLTVEVKKLMEASRNGEFVLNLKPGWPVSKNVIWTETFDSICPSVSTMECTCPSPTEGTFALVYEGQATGLSTADKLGLAVGLPIALAALAALGVLLLFYLKKKKGSYRPPTKYRGRTVSPIIESFETNIYSASIDDNLSHQFGKKGAQLNRFRDPDAVYGRLSYSPPPSTASSTLTSEMSIPGTPDNFY